MWRGGIRFGTESAQSWEEGRADGRGNGGRVIGVFGYVLQGGEGVGLQADALRFCTKPACCAACLPFLIKKYCTMLARLNLLHALFVSAGVLSQCTQTCVRGCVCIILAMSWSIGTMLDVLKGLSNELHSWGRYLLLFPRGGLCACVLPNFTVSPPDWTAQGQMT